MSSLEMSPVIEGVKCAPLSKNFDSRGWLSEVYRNHFVALDMGAQDFQALQVNAMWSIAGSLRGSHVHLRHSDYFILLSGYGVLGLFDLRKDSKTYGKSDMISLSMELSGAVLVPPGVVHGIYFPTDSFLVTIESSYYDPEEEFRVKWNAPQTGIAWPCKDPILSEADKRAPSFEKMLQAYTEASREES